MSVRRRAGCLLLCALVVGCGQQVADAIPSAMVATAPSPAPFVLPTPTPAPPTATAVPVPTATLEPLAQYRLWMEEARAQHPYGDPVEKMWAVMLCESSGDAAVVSGVYYGLFQYLPETWAGEWNPYRDQPILDPRAQIFATAKAWYEGNQGWWGCY